MTFCVSTELHQNRTWNIFEIPWITLIILNVTHFRWKFIDCKGENREGKLHTLFVTLSFHSFLYFENLRNKSIDDWNIPPPPPPPPKLFKKVASVQANNTAHKMNTYEKSTQNMNMISDNYVALKFLNQIHTALKQQF